MQQIEGADNETTNEKNVNAGKDNTPATRDIAFACLKKFFMEVAIGRTDYENLMPMTIGINVNYQ